MTLTKEENRQTLIAKLIDHVGDVTFVYGRPLSRGTPDCAILMSIEKDERRQPCYFGTICTKPLPGREAEGIRWEVTDELGDTLACGLTGRRGQFIFPVDPQLRKLGVKCELRFGPVPELTRALPERAWRRIARESEFVGKAGTKAATPHPIDQGVIRLAGNRLWVRASVNDVPYGVVCVVAVRKAKVTRAILLPMPVVHDDGMELRKNSLHIRDLIDWESPGGFEYDAWAVTDDPLTWRHTSRTDLEKLLDDVTSPGLSDVNEGIQQLLASGTSTHE